MFGVPLALVNVYPLRSRDCRCWPIFDVRETMKAVCLSAPGEIALVDLPEQRRGCDEVLIRVRSAGICGSDIGAYKGVNPSRISPLVALTGVVADDRTLGRRRLITAVLGVLLILAGAALTGVAVLIGVPEITAVGAVVLTLGILAALPLLVVGASRLRALRHLP